MRDLILFFAAVALLWFLTTRSPVAKSGMWVVYGDPKCGWTRKQVGELKKKGVPHQFKSCGEAPDGCREGMPVNVLPDGSRKLGFTSVD